MNGEDIMFVAGGQVFNGKVKGSRLEGTITTPKGPVAWSATKQ
jgi:hypothetical protein